ncbi:MAG: acyltransferase [Vicinamibacterales bacterium]
MTNRTSAHDAPTRSFRTDIEGLRAVAILLVVAYHAGLPGFSGGYIGVDVFFVLSGYLITSLLLGELISTGSIHVVDFFARRVRRLLAASATTLVVCMLVSMVVYAPVEQDGLANTALATAGYASNLYFARASTDYLATPVHTNPLLHTWSLTVEEQFYFVWPFLMVLVGAGAIAADQRRRRLLITVAVLTTVTLAGAVYLTNTVQPWAFFLSPPRAWEFALGGLCAVLLASFLRDKQRRRVARARSLVGWGSVRSERQVSSTATRSYSPG